MHEKNTLYAGKVGKKFPAASREEISTLPFSVGCENARVSLRIYAGDTMTELYDGFKAGLFHEKLEH